MTLQELPRITQLDLAFVELPDTHPAASLSRTIPVHGFLVHHPDGAILVDTGVGLGNEFIDNLYRPTRTSLEVALAAHGVALDQIVAVVNSTCTSTTAVRTLRSSIPRRPSTHRAWRSTP